MGGPARFTIAPPPDYVLARDACSYGYFLLWPNHWDPRTGTFSRVLDLEGGTVLVRITQQGSGEASGPRAWAAHRGRGLVVVCSRALGAAERREARAQISRMLRLDEPSSEITDFHSVDPRWKRLGRGRLFRSPTFFEDVLKTVTSCNVQWPGTVTMNRRLCEVVGRPIPPTDGCACTGSFPSPARLARTRPQTLRARCRTGYRDARIVELARLFARGRVDPAWFEDPTTPDEDLHKALLDLPGVGPYAAANVMQLLGRYHRLPLDTESVRHGRTVLGFRGSSKQVMKRVAAHFEPFGRHAFRSYWFEMWAFYESKRGRSWTWDQEAVGSSFTASQF